MCERNCTQVCHRRRRAMAHRMTSLAGRTLLVLLALVAALAAPRHAAAAPGVKYGLTDDAWLAHGPGTLESRLPTPDSLGVKIVRYTLRWNEIAGSKPANATDPEDPAYDWEAQSAVLDGLRG